MVPSLPHLRPWWLTAIFLGWLSLGVPLLHQFAGTSHAESALAWSLGLLLFGVFLWAKPHQNWLHKELFFRVLVGWMMAACLSALWPWLNLFDAHTNAHLNQRLLTLGGAMVFGWLTIGGGLYKHRWFKWFGWLCLAGLLWGTLKGIETAGELTNRKLYRGTISNPWILTIFGMDQPLTEKHWAWVPYISLTIASFAAVCFGATLRLWSNAFHPGTHSSAQKWGALFIGASLVPLQFHAIQPLARDNDPSLVGLPDETPWNSWLSPLAAGNPFHDFFRYQVVVNQNKKIGQFISHGQIFRVMERNSSDTLGRWHLASGREVLTTDAADRPLLASGALLALAAQPVAKSALLIGHPEPTMVKEWQRTGVQKVDLSSDPVDQTRLDWLFNPDWAGIKINQILSLKMAQSQNYDLVLVAPAAPWRAGESPLRPGWLKKIAACVGKDRVGALLIPLNHLPAELAPNLLKEFSEAFAEVGECRSWLILRGLQTPALLLIAGPPSQSDAFSPLIKIGLEANGCLLENWGDAKLLEIPPTPFELTSNSVKKSAAWARLRQRIANGVPKEVLAAEALQSLPPTSVSSALSTFLSQQQWTLVDSQFVPELQKLDLTHHALMGFLELARSHPKSKVVRQLWISLAQILVEKREVEWNQEALPILLNELGWRHPVLLWAAGTAALEALEPDLALSLAKEALVILPEMAEAQALAAAAEAALKGD